MLGNAQRPENIRAVLASNSRDGLIPALWLQSLLNLSSTTTDERVEVRNSATQTIQRIFESYAEQLSASVWMLCLRVVLFDMIEANIATHRRLRSVPEDKNKLKGWDDTTKTVLHTASLLYTAYMERLEPAQLGDAWSELLGYLQQYFDCESHSLGFSVFTTITDVLSHVDNSSTIGMASLLQTATTWKCYFDHREAWTNVQEDNQDAFVAYADAFKTIYRLAGQSVVPQLSAMLANLEACIVTSDAVAYSSDIDHMTPLQLRVIECLSMIKTEGQDLPSNVIGLLSRFVTLPYTSLAEDPQKRSPTFVALAKAAMTLLQDVVIKHIEQRVILTDGSFLLALRSLAKPIHEKYSWQCEGKPPTLWQKATITAVAIMGPALPILTTHSDAVSASKEIWTTLVDLSYGITRAEHSSSDKIVTSMEKDEAFDVDSFTQLRNLITLSIGSTSIPDALRRTYTRNLFTISLISTPLPGELPDLASTPLEGLYKIRYGQTAELETTRRIDMSYTCLSELFNLVTAHDGTPPRVKLAQAASPYLILRAAIPLKTYIADQPIRGRMPMPEAQRRELLFVLNELEKLNSEPQAIPDAPGVRSKHRKHLHRLYPLLVKAAKAARYDAEVFECLARLMHLVGGEFGLEED
jgi:hypothetical protein